MPTQTVGQQKNLTLTNSNHIHPCWQPKSSIVLPLNPTSVLTNISIMKSASPSTPPLTPVDDDESERRTVMVSSHLFDIHMVSFVSLVLISSILPLSSPIHKREPHTLPDKESWPNRPVMVCQNSPVSPLIESEHGSSPHPIGVPFVSYIYIVCITTSTIIFRFTKTQNVILCRNYRRTYSRVQ